MSTPNHKGRKDMEEAVRLRKQRRDSWKQQGERPLWKNLSMVGALGWLVVVPTLIGVFAGRWLDGLFGSGVTFSGAMTFLGAGLGFYLAWKRMNEE
ncbi:AtpZ/AtpI family protein [Mameliella sp. CS4]|uniref:AtpZ/AtpI family protein n=1 Tax=Mameliella sp. CS4 TaxID=2862329 RepID=UPI001C603566|nr:AtpZ/AtpI family protein [Mameliella sp. CS4]MBW4982726.1 AtpZ/AtpI family protein [Mameliella sp. CS4]